MRAALGLAILLTALICATTTATAVPRLTLSVRDGDGLRRYRLRGGAWIPDGRVDLTPFPTKRMRFFRRMLPTPQRTIVLATDGQLIEVDARFGMKVRFRAPSGTTIGAFARSGSSWIVACGGQLLVLDAQFHRIAALRVLKSDQKSAHAILVDGAVAYVLDNIYQPIWAFRIDLRDPRQPKMVQRLDFSGVNVHLSGQFLDRARKLWTILRDQSTLYGMSQQLFDHDLARPDGRRVATHTLFSYSRRHGKLLRPDWNRRLLAVTPFGRFAVVVTHGPGDVALVRPLHVGNGLQLKTLLRIPSLVARWYSHASYSLSGTWLALHLEKTLFLFDLRRANAPRLVQRFPRPTNVHDLLLTHP